MWLTLSLDPCLTCPWIDVTLCGTAKKTERKVRVGGADRRRNERVMSSDGQAKATSEHHHLCSSSLPAVIMSHLVLPILQLPCAILLSPSTRRVYVWCNFSTAGEKQPTQWETSREMCERKNTLPVGCIKPSVSLLSPAIPSAVCPPHPLSSYRSVYSAWHCLLSPRFQREAQRAECDSIHLHEDSGSDWKKIFQGWRGEPLLHTRQRVGGYESFHASERWW